MSGIGPGHEAGAGTGGAPSGNEATRFHEWLRTRLSGKGYQELRVTPQMRPLRLAFLRPAGAIADARVIGVVDTAVTSNTPAEISEHLKSWFQTTQGSHRGGPGLLLLVCYNPSALFVDAVKKGSFYAGNVSVEVAAYDAISGTHWLSRTSECTSDVFDS